MAAISTGRVSVIWDEGSAPRWTFYKIKNFNTADTLDLSSLYSGTIEVATFITSQVSTVGTVSSSTAAVLTLTLVGSTAATGYLVVRGQASTGTV